MCFIPTTTTTNPSRAPITNCRHHCAAAALLLLLHCRRKRRFAKKKHIRTMLWPIAPAQICRALLPQQMAAAAAPRRRSVERFSKESLCHIDCACACVCVCRDIVGRCMRALLFTASMCEEYREPHAPSTGSRRSFGKFQVRRVAVVSCHHDTRPYDHACMYR